MDKSDETWRAGSEVPDIPRRTMTEFIVAVRRVHTGKVHSFAASYLNAYPLNYNHECPKGDGCAGEGCDDGCPTTGWFYETGNDDEGSQFNSLELTEGDELLGWRNVPQWPGPERPGPAKDAGDYDHRTVNTPVSFFNPIR